ncbi:MAG TPA: c-type cytochrome [Candidatus Binatia bacterium]|nr:c-type cytochrome [Candidatus Binatia bacterium]
MSSHSPESPIQRIGGALLLLVVLLALLVAGVISFPREKRDLPRPSTAVAPQGPRGGALHAGPSTDSVRVATAGRPGEYRETAQAVSEGQQLFHAYNCSGCHSDGGGGMGAILMDRRWYYGHEPGQIFDTIVQGRQNGMPSFAGRIPAYQVWELVAYVRSLSGLVSPDAASGRDDHMEVAPPPNSLRMRAPLLVRPLPPNDSASVKGTTAPGGATRRETAAAKGAP